mmetsp:Transcript_24119/g.24402  ORF Transcript_24119/g.24402 Transcript_24119/m.24402 type:complete len:128 (+) Transcript_24119:344-727(+)
MLLLILPPTIGGGGEVINIKNNPTHRNESPSILFFRLVTTRHKHDSTRRMNEKIVGKRELYHQQQRQKQQRKMMVTVMVTVTVCDIPPSVSIDRLLHFLLPTEKKPTSNSVDEIMIWQFQLWTVIIA